MKSSCCRHHKNSGPERQKWSAPGREARIGHHVGWNHTMSIPAASAAASSSQFCPHHRIWNLPLLARMFSDGGTAATHVHPLSSDLREMEGSLSCATMGLAPFAISISASLMSLAMVFPGPIPLAPMSRPLVGDGNRGYRLRPARDAARRHMRQARSAAIARTDQTRTKEQRHGSSDPACFRRQPALGLCVAPSLSGDALRPRAHGEGAAVTAA